MMLSIGGDGGEVDVALHGGQWFDLPPGPASLPLPQATGRPDAQPAVASGLADDALVMVHV